MQQAIDMTSLYRQNRPANFPVCETFNKSAVLELLNNPEAVFLRLYYGMSGDYAVHAILVAADADGEDMLPAAGGNDVLASESQEENVILEDGFRCPQYCPPASPLNT